MNFTSNKFEHNGTTINKNIHVILKKIEFNFLRNSELSRNKSGHNLEMILEARTMQDQRPNRDI